MQVYGIQFGPKWEEKDYNFREVERILEAEKIAKNSLIVLPEMFATGFSLKTEITSSDEPEKRLHFYGSYRLATVRGYSQALSKGITSEITTD